MNDYCYKDIKIGLVEEFEEYITEEKMKIFMEITDDVNPLHCDEDFARSRGYNGRVVYGMLTSSLYSTLAGVYLPGKNSLIQSINIKMLKPVYIGDKLTISGKVTEVHDIFNMIVVKAQIRNSDNEKVSRADIQIGVLEGNKDNESK